LSPDVEFPEYLAGAETTFLLSLTMKIEESYPMNASSRDITTGMMTTIIQQQEPPMRRARDSEISSDASVLLDTT